MPNYVVLLIMWPSGLPYGLQVSTVRRRPWFIHHDIPSSAYSHFSLYAYWTETFLVLADSFARLVVFLLCSFDFFCYTKYPKKALVIKEIQCYFFLMESLFHLNNVRILPRKMAVTQWGK
jgi:hypothetical protein